MTEERINEILLKLQELHFAIGRLVSDAESEKEFRKERNREIEKRLKELELWKSELHGRIIVTVSVAGVIWAAIIAVIVKLIK